MIKVFYHANCTDGFGAAYVAWLALCPRDNIEFIPIAYGQEPEYRAGDTIYILDFSFPRDTLVDMINNCRVILLDHHKAAKEDLADLVNDTTIKFDMKKCGTRLAWEYFYPGQLVPRIIRYIEDRDLWKWELSYSREISAAIRSYEMNFDVWKEHIWNRSHSELMNEGSAILRNENKIVEMAVKNAREIDLYILGGETYRVMAVNNPVCMSEIGEALARDRDFSVVYYQQKDGSWKYSLRSRSDNSGYDVSLIAKKYGGGGHRNAAGFTTPTLIF